MKNYRGLFPIVLTVLMFVSVYSMISDAESQKREIQQMLQTAKSYAEQELFDKAASVYNEVIFIENRVEYYLSVADMYYEAKDYEESEVWSENALKHFPEEAKAYEKCLRVYIKQGAYSDAYSVLQEFDGRRLSSEKVEEYRERIEFTYQEIPILYEKVIQPSSGFVGVQDEEKWGLITTQGGNKVRPKYKQIGYYANRMIPICDEKGIWYFMNESGEYLYNISKSVGGEVTDVGLYNEKLVSICVDGSYSYYDINFKKKLGTYDYAGTFNGGVAAVKNGRKWELINNKGEKITKNTYEDIIIDERGVCCLKERIFVKTNEEYIMIDKLGQQIGKETFEGAKVFANDDYAAIMRGDLWGFVDIEGKIVIEPEYQDAKSFSMELAAVCIDNVWGYINIKNEEVIKIQYANCLTFSSDGSAFVQDIYGAWKVFKLYKYNH